MDLNTNIERVRNAAKQMFSPIVSIILAVMISVLFVMWAKEIPMHKYFITLADLMRIIVSESFGTPVKMLEVVVYASPLLFCGLAHIVAFKADLFNIGVEGQFIIGMLFASVLGQLTGLSAILHQPLIIVAGMIGAGFWGSVQGYLKAKLGTNEVVVGIMMNFLAMYIASFVALRTSISDISSNATFAIQKSAQLLRFTSSTRANVSIFLALITSVFLYLLLNKSVRGFKIRAVGFNPKAAELGGVNVKSNIIYTMALSGAIAGLGGLTHVAGVQLRMASMISLPGYGFDGIAVALLASNSPFGSILSAMLFGAFKASARIFQLNGIPKEIGYIIQGVIIMFVAMNIFKKVFKKGSDVSE